MCFYVSIEKRKLKRHLLSMIFFSTGPRNLDKSKKQTPGATTIQVDDDDEVPELVAGETFEAAAEEGSKP